jgi:AhpD family alkylhydroperoxidase
MNKKIDIYADEPKAFEEMMGLEKYLAGTPLKESHKHLIKIRASQINGCAYCINMHTKDALKAGETQQRIFMLNAWRETALFNEEEKTILALTEEVTFIHRNGLSDATYNKALELFGPNYLAQLVVAASTINSWNRILISLRKDID